MQAINLFTTSVLVPSIQQQRLIAKLRNGEVNRISRKLHMQYSKHCQSYVVTDTM